MNASSFRPRLAGAVHKVLAGVSDGRNMVTSCTGFDVRSIRLTHTRPYTHWMADRLRGTL